MRKGMASIAAITVAGLLSLNAGAQTPPQTGAGSIGGPNAATPSGAAMTHTPGTPGASDTPAALQSSHPDSSSAATPSPAQLRKLKKQAAKASSSPPQA
jgi:hypothetical protein